MANQEGKYSIKAASKMLGIQPGTLRAWERRYKMVAPIRSEAGYRLYTEENIKILKWIISKMNQGYTVSQAVSLLENKQMKPEKLSNNEGDFLTNLSDELLEAFINFDESKAQDLINYCFSLYTIDKVTVEILGTIILKIGKMREHSEISSAHEQFAISILRSRIGMILHTLPHNGLLPKALAICGPGDLHEIGLLIFTLFLKQRGFVVVFLGAGIAEEDWEEAIMAINPKFLFLSCTLKENLPATIALAERIISHHKTISVGIVGNIIETLDYLESEKYISMTVGFSQKEWEIWLKGRIG